MKVDPGRMRRIVDALTVVGVLSVVGLWLVRTGPLRESGIATATPQPLVRKELSRAELHNLATGGLAVGDAEAAVQILAFMDYGCGWCKEYDTVLETIQRRYPQHTVVVYKDFVLDTLSPVFDVHLAARCAADQGQFLSYHKAAFFDQQTAGERNGWKRIAASLQEIDQDRLQACVLNDVHRAAVLRDTRQARELGFALTPSSILGKSLVSGSLPLHTADSIVAGEIRTATRRSPRNP